MRCAVMLLSVGALLLVGGCGGSSHPHSAAADAQVESGTCQSASAGGRTVSQSCEFVLSDGERFRCPQTFQGQTPTALELAGTKGCVRLRSLELSGAVRAMIAALDTARSCLIGKKLHALGGPVLPPNPARSTSADGEALITSPHPTFIAFYTDATRAQRLEPTIAHDAHRFGGQVERRGATAIVWPGAPTSTLRATVEACVFR